NILVTEEGEPKLLDFGIAKLLDPQLGGPEAEETGAVLRLMTPEYASPEQLRAERVTTASDVYSLGVILYELLTQRRLFALKGSLPTASEWTLLLERDPPPPSTAAGRDGSPRLRRALRGDLDTIVLKALAKEPTRRYATAAELGDDVRRYLDGVPVRARPQTRAYRAAKFLRRHLAASIALAVAFALTLGGLGLALWQA